MPRDPPDGAHTRALRLPRGPVPGRRGRLGTAAGAAVLPRDHARPRSTASARRSPRRCGVTGRERARRRPGRDRARAPVPRPAPGRASGEVDGPMERHCVRLLPVRRAAGRRARRSRSTASSSSAPRFMHDAGLYDSISHGGVYTDESGELRRAAVPRRRRPARAGAAGRRRLRPAPRAARPVATRDRGRADAARRPDRGQRRDPARGPRARSEVRRIVSRQVSRDGFYSGVAGLLAHALRDRPLTPAADLQDRLR